MKLVGIYVKLLVITYRCLPFYCLHFCAILANSNNKYYINILKILTQV